MSEESAHRGPVPSFESLSLDGPPLVVSANVRAQQPRLAPIGEEDAVVVYGQYGAQGPTLVSHRLHGAFSKGPMRIGEATLHSSKDNHNSMGALVAWPDGTFAVPYGSDWIFAATDEPGARATFSGSYVFDPSSDTAYALESEGDRTRVLRRAKRFGDSHVDDCGLLPKSLGYAAVVGDGGALFLAALGKTPKTKVFVASRTGLVAGATLAVPEKARVSVLPRPGGAYLVASSFGACAVHTLDAKGQPCTTPRSLPVVSPGDHLVAVAAWRDGVALASTRGHAGVGLAVTSGGHATFSAEALRGVMDTGRLVGLTASHDGATLVFAYVFADRAANGGVFVARLRCGAGDPAVAFVPTVELPGRSIDSVPPTPIAVSTSTLVVASSLPPAPKVPPYRASPFGTRDSLVRFFRRLSLMNAFGLVRETPLWDADASGSLNEGHLFGSNGQGNHFIAHWDATGVVVLGFDHERHESEWETPLDLRNPGKHLPGVPAELKPLALRATDWGERLATEGLWIAAGERPAHGEAGELDVLSFFTGLSGEGESLSLLMESRDPPAQLIARLAELDAYVVTPADAAAIFASAGPPRGPLTIADVETAVAALARLGVAWPDAATQAEPVRRREERALRARLPEHDRALLLAAHSGDLEGVKQALASGAALDCRMPEELLPYTPADATPLLVAMQMGHTTVAEHLIEEGADVEARVAASHGQGTALRAAAAQGNLRLFQLLLARGASVEPEEGSWGLLQVVTYPRRHLPRGTPADYAEVIRLLLEAGAPLPNDAHCEELVQIVNEAGALELAPRLRRVYAEDVLPALPSPIDPSVAPRVTERLVQAAASMAHDNARSLRLLIEAWQLNPLPRVGELAERLALRVRGPRPGYPIEGRAGIDGEATLRALREALTASPDPRAARAILGWLQTADLYTNRAVLARCIDAAAALLIHVRDVRHAESLAQHCELRPVGGGPTRESLRVALHALRDTAPFPLEAVGEEALSRMEDAVAGRRIAANRFSVRALLEAVYDDPDDDAPRHVLADRLIEDDDPRGELIALQLARYAKGGKPSKREKELLAENGRAWLGEIARILADDFVFERGFLVQASTAESGNSDAAHSLPLLASGAGTQLEWSTVRRLSLWRHAHLGTAGMLRGPRLLGLRELCDAGPEDVSDLLAGPARPLERLDFAFVRRPERWTTRGFPLQDGLRETLPEKLPALRSLRLPSRDGTVEWIAPLVAGLPALGELSVALGYPDLLRELVALARAHNLARVQLLGPVDFAFELQSGSLEITFPGRLVPPLAVPLARVLGRARDLGVQRVVVRTPVRAKLVDEAPTPNFVRRSERLELRVVVEACERLGVPFAVEAHKEDTFAPNPTRAE